MHQIEHIESLFVLHGSRPYGDPHPVAGLSRLQHALQCAQLAEWAYADDALVAAALLQDLGEWFKDDDVAGFGPAVVEPIRLQVLATRYLASTDPNFAERLVPAEVQALERQGGAMGADEVRAFEDMAYAADAVALRRWVDLAKVPGKHTPPLAYYLGQLEALLERPFVDSKIGIGSLSIA